MSAMRAWVLVCYVVLAGCGEVSKSKPGGTCTTAADCTDPGAPFCVDSKCQATCVMASDCTDPTKPVCATNGACVGCETDAQCTAAAPVCDTTSHACRGCAADAECTGGLCVEAAGTCALDTDAAFVTMMGTDTGTCTRAAPCATLTFAIGQIGTRHIIHVLGGSLALSATTTLTGNLVLDGENTVLQTGNTTALSIQAPAMVTVEGFQLAAPTGGMVPGILVNGFGAKATLHALAISGSGSLLVRETNSAELELSHSHIGTLTATSPSRVSCENSKLKVDQCVFETSLINDGGTTCEAAVTRSQFQSAHDGSVQLTSGQLVMENNVVIHLDGFNDSIVAANLRPGSTIRFNTIVNTTGAPSDGAALSCDGSVEVTSNIFAYNSMHPITGTGCVTRYSVFDDVSTTSAGTGNQTTGIDKIFVNRGTGDYHLAPTSVARMGAEPGQNMVTTDFDGMPRPNPTGTTADSGAFEAP